MVWAFNALKRREDLDVSMAWGDRGAPDRTKMRTFMLFKFPYDDSNGLSGAASASSPPQSLACPMCAETGNDCE